MKDYARYTDDFVIVDDNKQRLVQLIDPINNFLASELQLRLHPDKIIIRKLAWGVDFLGYTLLPYHRLVKTKTRRRIFAKVRNRVREYKAGIITAQTMEQSLQSYLGVLSHANTYRVEQKLKNHCWFWLNE